LWINFINDLSNIIEIQKRVSALKDRKTLELILFVEIKKAEKYFLEAQKEQLGRGENRDGKIIGTYSQATENIAKLENTRKPKIAGQAYNFEYYGDFFDDMVLDVFEDSASFFSTDPKTEELIKKYEGLFGLQEDELEKIIKDIIAPAFSNEIRKVLQLI